MKNPLLLVAVLVALGAGFVSIMRAAPETGRATEALARDPFQVQRTQLLTGVLEIPATEAPSSLRNSRTPAVEGTLVSASTGVLSGIVVDASHSPMEGVSCEILFSSPPTGLTGLVSRAPDRVETFERVTSDGNGGFSLEVPPGFWTLRVCAEGMAPWEERHLSPGEFRWVRLRAARELTVVVVDGSGAPLAGAEVSLLRGQYGDPQSAVLSALSDGTGAALLESIPSGSWFVHVSHPEHVSQREAVPGPGKQQDRLEVTLPQGIRVEGQVTLAADGGPPTGTVVLFETTGGFVSSQTATCDSEGRYSSRTAFPVQASMELAVLAPGFGESRREVRLRESGGSAVQVEDFVLESLERTAVGRAVDGEGKPLGGVEVYVRPLASLPPETIIRIPTGEQILAGEMPDLTAFDPRASAVARLRHAAVTDATGTYRLVGLHPRRAYSVLLVSPAYSNAALWLEEALPGEGTDLGTATLGPGGRIWGHVLRPDGSPVEGALVYSVNWTTNEVVPDSDFQTTRPTVRAAGLEAITSDSGYFEIQPFPKSEFRLYFEGSLTEVYHLDEGGELGGLELVVPDSDAEVPVRLNVIDTLGAPVPHVYASMTGVPAGSNGSDALPYDYAAWESGTGDQNGLVDLSARAGLYEVEVKDLQGLLVDEVFRIELEAEGLERDVVLLADPSPPGLLAGVVQSSLGQRLAGVEVTLIPTTGATSCGCLKTRVQTDGEGAFSFGPVMRGAHRLVIRDPEERHAPGHFYPARSGEPLVITLE